MIYEEAKRILENTSLESNLHDLKYKLVQKLIKLDEEKEIVKQKATTKSSLLLEINTFAKKQKQHPYELLNQQGYITNPIYEFF